MKDNEKTTSRSKKSRSPLFTTNLLLLALIVVSVLSILTNLAIAASSLRSGTSDSEQTEEAVSEQLSIPSDLQIQSVTRSQKWEYLTLLAENNITGPFGGSLGFKDSGSLIFEESQTEGVAQRLNTLGEQGWELVGITYNYGEIGALLVLKRPLNTD